MATEIETGIADIKKGGTDNDIQAGLQFALAALQIPQALHTCENMDEDVAAIEDWASVFKNPTKLARKLATHYAMHKNEIKADIKTLETDWDSAEYFKAGQELATIGILALGPIETTTVRDVNCGVFSLTTVEIADFLAGFMAGFSVND